MAELPPLPPGYEGHERNFPGRVDAAAHPATSRTLLLGAPLDGERASTLVALLLRLDRDSDQEIRLVVNSAGGDLMAGLAVCDAIACARSPVRTLCAGAASGAAALILASGTPGLRAALPHSRVILRHDRVPRFTDDLIAQSREARALRGRALDLLARRSLLPRDELLVALDDALALDAHEARTYGLLDEVITKETRNEG